MRGTAVGEIVAVMLLMEERLYSRGSDKPTVRAVEWSIKK